jgi:hypothetical protein
MDAPATAPPDATAQLLDLVESIGKPCQGGMGDPQVAKVAGRWVHCESLAEFEVTSVGGSETCVCKAHVEEAQAAARRDGVHFPFPLVNELWVTDTVKKQWPAVIARAKARGV